MLALSALGACSIPEDAGGALSLETRPLHDFKVPESATDYDAGAVEFVPCTDVTSFVTHVVPPLVEYCGPKCHDEGKLQARGTLDLDGIGDMAATLEVFEEACGNTLAKVKPNDISQSALFLSPDPLVMDDHTEEFKFEIPEQQQAFQMAVMTWLASELGEGPAAPPGMVGGEVPVGEVPGDQIPGGAGEVPTGGEGGVDTAPPPGTTGGAQGAPVPAEGAQAEPSAAGAAL